MSVFLNESRIVHTVTLAALNVDELDERKLMRCNAMFCAFLSLILVLILVFSFLFLSLFVIVS